VVSLQRGGTILQRKRKLKTALEIVPRRARPSITVALLKTVIPTKGRKIATKTQMSMSSDQLYLITLIRRLELDLQCLPDKISN
jgi:hypothetical protein